LKGPTRPLIFLYELMPPTLSGNASSPADEEDTCFSAPKKYDDKLFFLNLKSSLPSPLPVTPSSDNGGGKKNFAKKPGKCVIRISGTRHYKNDSTASQESSLKECQLLKHILRQIEESGNNCLDIYQITLNLVLLTHDPIYLNEYSEVYSLALKSQLILDFLSKYFKSIHTKYFYGRQQNRQDTILTSTPQSEPTFAIPFDERRDSFPCREDESKMLLPRWVYDNRQKLRDGLVFVLQEFIPSRSISERQVSARAKELIFSKMVYLNGAWLAELVLGEYLKWIVPKPSVSRMDLLEQRLNPKPSTHSRDECFEFFSILLRNGDCLSLSLGLHSLIPKKIRELEEICCHGALRRNELFRDSFVKIYELVNLFKFISNELSSNSANYFLKELVLEASKNRCLLLHLKWIWEEKNLLCLFENFSFGPASFGLFQLLGAKAKYSNSINSVFIDADDALEHSFIVEQMRPDLVKALANSFVNGSLLLSGGVTTPDSSLPSPRKIQPTSLPSTPKIEAPNVNRSKSETQLELRKWFWWQHPNEYELVKGILLYLRHNVKFSTGETLLKETLSGLLNARSLPQQVNNAIISLAIEELREYNDNSSSI
jgi:hypothetical protein